MRRAPAFCRPVICGGLLAAAGCNFAPHYERPGASTPTQFKEAAPGGTADQGWKIAEPRDAEIRGNWWEVFNDPQLDALEARVAISNQTVIAAEANYRAARALVAEAQAQLFPTLNLAPAVTRGKSSAAVTQLSGGATGTAGTTGTAATTAAQGTTSTRNTFTLPLEISYQIDLWGSVRNTVAQSRYNAQMSAAQLATALLSTQSTLAQDYFQLRIADEQRRILETTVADYEATLRLVRTLFDNGLDSGEDVSQAESQLQSTMAQATDVGVARAQYEHAIAVLIGVPPAKFSIPYKHLSQPLPTVPVGVPSDLLERRPDIAAAERQVAASNAAIGVARAAYFPSLTLSGSAGYESTQLSRLFEGPNRFWSAGPTLVQNLFDAGERRAAVAQARALNEAQTATYRQTVLSAFQAVEDNLASLRILSQELLQQHQAAVTAKRTVQLSVVRFQNGVDSYVNVITAQNTFLTAREAELQIQLRQLTAGVNLINNLGGGWSTAEWQATEQMALHPADQNKPPQIPADNSGPAVPNPPAMPAGEVKPDDIIKQDEDDMGAPQPPQPPQPSTRPP
jgi:NodT family efflux transporter outer membrane factor (OMF) lipoprotein